MEYLHWYMILVVLLLSILALKSPSLALVFCVVPSHPQLNIKVPLKEEPSPYLFRAAVACQRYN